MLKGGEVMKTKFVLGLTVCCLLSALVTSLVTSRVQAQAPNPVLGGWPFSVNFVEDPFRMHGIQVKSWAIHISDNLPSVIPDVPPDKRFILTDILGEVEGPVAIYSDHYPPTILKVAFQFTDGMTYSLHLNSGIVFEPGESIYIEATSSVSTVFITISGYFVDL